jgi:hypothetical protein
MAEEQVRAARETETRATSHRKESWAPPETLPQPKPVKGYEHRYIRTTILGQNDPRNVSAKFREGWEPVSAKDPHYADMLFFSDPDSRGAFKDNIEIGGLVLCRAPVEMVRQRAAYYAAQNDQQMQAVDNSFMKTNDPRMPLFSERKTNVTFGRGGKQS